VTLQKIDCQNERPAPAVDPLDCRVTYRLDEYGEPVAVQKPEWSPPFRFWVAAVVGAVAAWAIFWLTWVELP
jgi:hypothetical protein